MSRSGTLQDALRSVDAFHRAAAAGDDDGEDGRGPSHRSRRKEKSSKDKEKKRKERRRRKRNAVSEERSDEDGSGESGAEERKQERREKQRKERKRRKEEGDEEKKGSKSSSSKRGERKREKEKEKESERKRRKRKERKAKDRPRWTEESDSVSSKGDDDPSASESSERGGGEPAVRADQVAADIANEFPEVEDDLRQLLGRVDSGEAVDISGIPDKRLSSLLRELFGSLRLKRSSAGAYLLPSGSQPTLERFDGFSQSKERPESSKSREEFGTENPPFSPIENKVEGKTEQATAPEPECGPPTVQAEQAHKRRVIGPAMPSAEVLEAAAKLTAAEQALRDTEAELENDPMIGPPPPALVAEASSANDAERFEEVTRLTAADAGDAYELLGLKRSANPADLKKRYWKLSLLVHPDKCPHPQAQQAFMALNKAFKDLQDPAKRAEIDRKAEEKIEREEIEAERRARREAAQWRKLRGEEPHADDAELLRGDDQGPVRDEWMRVLPPERKVGGPPSQHNTFFSRTERSGRGDTSVWTDTPLEKAQKAKMQYLEAYQQAALADRPAEEMDKAFKTEQAAKTAALIDQHNEKKRSVSLLQEHQRKRAKETTAKRAKKGGPVSEEAKQPWAETHPWRPWDREKDLAAGRLQTRKWEDKKGTKEALSSRFGSGGGRNFL